VYQRQFHVRKPAAPQRANSVLLDEIQELVHLFVSYVKNKKTDTYVSARITRFRVVFKRLNRSNLD
ncbi:hypothetical protein QG082_09955, partial [Kingella kingae]|uniref:hypothetical protein n=1 Tax=Kingella kingae TaxID=504 RepID=UPI00254A1BC8